MSTISSIASGAMKEFNIFLDELMPKLLFILKNCNKNEQKILRALTLECISIISTSVDKNKFKKFMKELIEYMIYIQTNELDDYDPQRVYLLAAWERLVIVFKQDILPYLD